MTDKSCMNCAEAEECGTVVRYAESKPMTFRRLMASTEIECKDFKEDENGEV